MFEKSFLVEGIFKHISGNRQTGKGIQKLNERKRINEQNRKKDCMHMHGPKSDSDLHPVCDTCHSKSCGGRNHGKSCPRRLAPLRTPLIMSMRKVQGRDMDMSFWKLCPAIQDGSLSMSPVTGPTVLKSL